MKPKIISIVTPSYNQGQFIEETIQSVLCQEGDFYIDYIIMDGESIDNSVEIIKKYEKLLEENCKIVKKDGLKFFVKTREDFQWNRCLGISYRWESERDNGQVDALNKGFNRANGQVLAFLNSDDVYYQPVFQQIAKSNWQAVDFVYGKGMWLSEQGREILLYPTFSPTKYNLFYQCTLCQPTVFFSSEMYRELGEFSMDYPDVFDYEYWIRATFAHKTGTYVNKLLAKSRMYKENKSMAQRNSISKQVGRLKQKYYYQPNQKVSKIKLFFTQFIVQRKTVNRVNQLFKILGHDIRYNFWKNVKMFKVL
jgi:glycosyltransferase involved in cell wall biosynthesis